MHVVEHSCTTDTVEEETQRKREVMLSKGQSYSLKSGMPNESMCSKS